MNKPSFEEAYRELKKSFVARLKGSVESIDNVLLQRQLKPLSVEDLHRAQTLVHNLSGSGTTFGFPHVTETARKADIFLMDLIKKIPEGQSLNDESFKELETLLADLRRVCEGAYEEAQNEGEEDKAPVVQEKRSAPVPGHKSHVLVVDDDEGLLELLTIKLRTKGMRVSQAREGQAALSIIKQDVPDIVVLDIMMPGISGHEVLRTLKQDPASVSVPVIMLTAQTQQQDVVNALHSGAIDYVIKPADPDSLASRIEKTLEAGRYTIMVVDNDQLILELLKSKCKEQGYSVLTAEDGTKAWQEIKFRIPDLVILDRMLPDMDGLEVLKNMREEESTKNIPVIILSNHSTQNDIDAGLQMGAQDYVAKPFIPDDLLKIGLKHIRKNN